MKMNFRVTVEIGPRTKTRVTAYSTAVNARTTKLANGARIKDAMIAKWIEDNLQEALGRKERDVNV